MLDYHLHNFSIYGPLIFVILQGVSIVSTDQKTLFRAIGSSLDIQPQYPKGKVSFAEWNFNGKKFAEYYSDHKYSFPESQFSIRVKGDQDKIGVIIHQLQLQDSGTFSVVVDGTGGQAPTQIFKLYIEHPVTIVQIKKTQMWKASKDSCDVDVKCAALGAGNVSYLWSGYKNASGAQLLFSLLPAEGAVTLNCTAANNLSSSFATETLSCSIKTAFPSAPLSLLKLISSLVAASPYLLVTIILSVKCYRAHGHHNQYAVTVIEE